MVSEYVIGQWLFVRFGGTDFFGKFACAKEHQVVVDVYYSEGTPGGYVPTRVPDYPALRLLSNFRETPQRVDFGRAASMILPIESPSVWRG